MDNELVAGFSTRLRQLIAGFSQTIVAKQVGVSRQAVSKWIDGRSFPKTHHIDKLAETLNTSKGYLLFGLRDNQVNSSNGNEELEHAFSKAVPLLDWQELTNLKNLDLNLCIENHPIEWIPKNTGDRVYALKIDDKHDSDFEKGTVITVDLDEPLKHGCKAIYLVDGKFPVCRKVAFDGAAYYLLPPPQSGFDPLKIKNKHIFCGTITFAILNYD